jgi:hypothetical protein
MGGIINYIDAPNPVKGMIVNTVIPVNVSSVRDSEARL